MSVVGLFCFVEQRLNQSRLCTEAVLLEPSLLSPCIQFYASLSQFLLYVVMPSSVHGAYRLPLPDTVPSVWCALPDYYVEDIAEFLLFVLQ